MARNKWTHQARGWISLAILVPVGIGAALSRPHFPPASWGYSACQAAGWLLFLAGGAMRWWAMLYVGGRKTTELVTTGPYSITRHPVYLGTFLLALSAAVLSQSVVFFAAVLVARMAYLGVTVPPEERKLLDRHGEEFAAYCRRVPRLLPSFGRFQSPETIEVHVRGLRTELVRTCRYVWIPLACEVLTRLRVEDWWPIRFSLW
jgi:protein-S-isoprenylcysteine O-methyltransferase Ste14